MSQPPEDRRPMPWEQPDDAPGADEPTVPWTPPEPPPIDPEAVAPAESEPVAPAEAADAAEPEAADLPQADGPGSVEAVLAAARGDAPAADAPEADAPTADAPTADAPAPAPESPLISWAPSGGGDAAAPAAAGVAGAAASGGSPIVGWASPDAGSPASPVTGWIVAGVGSRILAWFIDLALLSFAVGFLFAVVAGIAPSIADDTTALGLVLGIIVIGLTFLYFVGLWTSGSGATLGMRLASLKVIRAADGGTLDIGPAIIRWIALGYPFIIVTLLPTMVSVVANWAYTIWLIVLLLTTAMSDVNQGLHDRWAKSAVVRQAGAKTNGLVIGCVILLIIAVAVLILPIVALIFLGSQVESILSEVGQSI